jgi:hypothetical protein
MDEPKTSVSAAFGAASMALFRLEHLLGPYGNADRQRVYELRAALGALQETVKRRA